MPKIKKGSRTTEPAEDAQKLYARLRLASGQASWHRARKLPPRSQTTQKADDKKLNRRLRILSVAS
jgi:hypothetical protein